MSGEGIPAALACELSGAYLIEASAGTGKTWTLTGIILRLLIEKKYAPERIIATTFTVAAAKEMQERIHARLVDFYECCLWLQNMAGEHDLYAMTNKERQQVFDEYAEGLPILADLINQHLLHFLLNEHPRQLGITLRRTALLLTTLDKLFVGTLDSLAQKWLKEFKSEIAHNENAAIVLNPEDTIYAIVHDALRAEQARLYHQNPELYACIEDGSFGDVAGMARQIGNALNFYSAKIDDYAFDEGQFDTLKSSVTKVMSVDFSVFLAYTDVDFRASEGISKAKAPFKFMDELPFVLKALQEEGVRGFFGLSGNQQKLLEALNAQSCDAAFLKKATAGLLKWQSLPNLDMLYRLGELYEMAKNLRDDYKSAFKAKLANHLKHELKTRLERQNQTTFVLQTARLNEALQGKQGQNLARHIRHLYPVALIDEAQDVSGEQAMLVERIYLAHQNKPHTDSSRQETDPKPKNRNFLLLVGDPKQAIYRFRGGDVANYNRMKAMNVDSSLSLTVNRRSNKSLIDSLNHWYGRANDDTPANEFSHLGSGIDYVHINAHNEHLGLDFYDKTEAIFPKNPLSIIHLSRDDDKIHAVGKHINSLLQSGARFDEDGVSRPLVPSDIAVLARVKSDIYQVANELESLGIAVVLTRDETVFDTEACVDCYAFLSVVADPRAEHLGAWLTGALMGYDWHTASTLLADESTYSVLILFLKKMRQLWATFGIMRMLNTAFAHHPITFENLWQKLAKLSDAERYLTDMWQMFEVLARQDLPMTSLLVWLGKAINGQANASTGLEGCERIALPSESGVSLMSIHKSKGLEFKIVYVLGLEGQLTKRDEGLYPYNDDKSRRLSPTKDKQRGDGYYKEMNHAEERAERQRLGYVALTRASEQTFVVVQNHGRSTDNMLAYYLDYEKGEFTKPTRLTDSLDWQHLDVSKLGNKPFVATEDDFKFIPYADSKQVYKKQDFIGISKTSFSGLARSFYHVHLPSTNQVSVDTMLNGGVSDDEIIDGETIVYAADYDEMAVDSTVNVALSANNKHDITHDMKHDIKNRFVRGMNAGSFLHKVLQYLDADNVEAYSRVIDTQVRAFDLPSVYLSEQVDLPLTSAFEASQDQQALLSLSENQHEALKGWLYTITHEPLAASNTTLASLDKADKVCEMKFVLGLGKSFNPQGIHELFERLGDKSLMPLVDTAGKLYQYLSGEIDLVYQKDGKYYVLDYKSNHLGDTADSYSERAMNQEMDKHGYWLQAAIYQVALHRMLKLRIADYVGNESRYLGAVEYYFVRGVNGTQTGHLLWDVPLALVQALDELFG